MISPQNFRRDVPLKKLEDVVVFKDNLRKPITSNERIEGPYPYYGANGIQGYINDFIFDEELVLLAEDGGHFYEPDRGIAYKVNGKTWVNNHAHVLSPKSNIDINYLWRVLENLDIKEYVNGTTRAKLTKSNALQIKIPLPPLAEQKRIADILDKANEIKAKRKMALFKLDELAQSTFIEMFGDPVENILKWETKNLGECVVKLGSGATPRGGDASYKEFGISLIRSLNIHDGEFKYKNLAFIDEQQAKQLSNVTVEENDVLLNITGASVARVCLVPKSVLPARVNQHVMIIRVSNELDSLFLEQLLLSPQIKNKLLKIGGSGATREAITKKNAQELEIIIPPITLQKSFRKIFEKISHQKILLKNYIKKIDDLNGSLQHQAFTTGFNA